MKLQGLLAIIQKHNGAMTAIFTALLVLVTAALVIVAVLQYFALDRTDRTLHETLVAANRAWLAPYDVRQDPNSPIDVGKPLRYFVDYRNVGRQPAIHVAFYEAPPGEDPPQINLRDWDGIMNWSLTFGGVSNETCGDRIPGEKASTVYPTDSLQSYMIDAGYTIPEEVKTTKKILYVEGCMAYTSFGKIRYEEYCFFLVPRLQDIPLSQWKFAPCPAGNFSRDR